LVDGVRLYNLKLMERPNGARRVFCAIRLRRPCRHLRKEAKAMLDAWVEMGELEVVEQYDATARKPRNFIKPASAPT
jgi:hypothetical protein